MADETDHPDRSVRAAGIADITARTVAQAMTPELGQPIVVDNRPGAGTVVATSTVARAAPDGYTLLLMSNASAVSTGLFRKLPFDVVKAFAPITTLGFFDLGVFVATDSRFQSLGTSSPTPRRIRAG